MSLIAVSALVAGCTSSRPLLSNAREVPTEEGNQAKKEIRFLDDISVSPQSSKTSIGSENQGARDLSSKSGPSPESYSRGSASIENASTLQIKYSILLNTEVEQVQNLKLYEYLDQWYGTRYCMGGTTKSCIDCSAFVQSVVASIYGITLPRTAREQHKTAQKISRTEMREGDLLFFNTTGGVSHVGIYLQNNKFIHASSSGGVMISDVFEQYWVRKFISVGRIK